MEEQYATLALGAIEATSTPLLLTESGSGAVVLERIARAAGATRWYVIRHASELQALARRLSPGSSVSFYFDERMTVGQYDDEVAEQVLALAARDGAAVLGTLAHDAMEVLVEYIAGPQELDEYTAGLSQGTSVVFGAVPGRDNDGLHAVTLDLPDLDGVVRPHPH